MRAKVLRYTITPLIAVLDGDSVVALTEGKPFVVMSGQEVFTSQLNRQLESEATEEVLQKLAAQSRIG